MFLRNVGTYVSRWHYNPEAQHQCLHHPENLISRAAAINTNCLMRKGVRLFGVTVETPFTVICPDTGRQRLTQDTCDGGTTMLKPTARNNLAEQARAYSSRKYISTASGPPCVQTDTD
jgi:hypothetical protein